MTSDELSERFLDFAVRIAKVVDALPKTKMGNHVGGQIASRDIIGKSIVTAKKNRDPDRIGL